MTGSKKLLSSLVWIFCIIITGPQAFATPGGGMMNLSDLELTAEQQSKVNQILENRFEEFSNLKKKVEVAQESIQIDLRGGSTEAQLRERFEEVLKQQNEFAQFRFETTLSVRALLTPEQRTKFETIEFGSQIGRPCEGGYGHRHGWGHGRGRGGGHGWRGGRGGGDLLDEVE